MTTFIEALADWSAPREVFTKHGPRLLRTARPEADFWRAWTDYKSDLKSAGIAITKADGGQWVVQWWQPVPDAANREQTLAASRATTADLEIPAGNGCQYMPFQLAGIAFAKDKPACLIADEMGLGKTIQALGVINADPAVQNVLIVTKASLKTNWSREAEKWLARPMSIGIASGAEFPETDVVVINYDIVTRHRERLRARTWDLVVLDEAHQIKNRNTARAKAIIGHTPSKRAQQHGEQVEPGLVAKRKLALTGTPIENRPDELWTTLHFLDPKQWPNFYRYAARYCGGHFGRWGYVTSGASNLAELQRVLRSTLMIRRMKRDVLAELPPKTRVLVELEPAGTEDALRAEKETWARHEAQLMRIQAELELAKASEDNGDFAKAVARFRSDASVAFREIAKVRHDTAVAKLPALIEAIREDLDEADKIIVFAHHLDVLNALHAAFEKQAVLLTGATSQADRDDAVQRFQTDPACRLFIGSIRAAGEGLNLQAANMVGFAELDWNPAKMSQCEDRAHRLGQRGNVLVKHWLVPGSLDARMIGIIVDKQTIIDQALDDEPGPLKVAEPVLVPHAPQNGTRVQLEAEGLLITTAQRQSIHRGLRELAAVCDGARRLDGCGFNMVDAYIGRSLASQNDLTDRQAALGRRICRRYVRQLGQELIDAMG